MVAVKFRMLDADGDGVVTFEEYTSSPYWPNEPESYKDWFAHAMRGHDEGRFREADINKDGQLDFPEMEWMAFLAERRGQVRMGREYRTESDEETFEMADADGSGKVDPVEFILAITGGQRPPRKMAKILDRLYAQADRDRNLGLDYDEMAFAVWLLTRAIRATPAVMQGDVVGVMFLEWDLDSNGLIEKTELVTENEMAGEHDGATALDMAVKHFERFDTNGDGAWNREEASQFSRTISLTAVPVG